jgi:hypothetical protein
MRMRGGTRRQVAIASIAAVAVFYFRYAWLPGASPYELFLLLNILVAILFRPKALLLSAALGLVAAHLLIGLEGGPLFTGEYWKLTLAMPSNSHRREAGSRSTPSKTAAW